jgi:chaperonin GroES
MGTAEVSSLTEPFAAMRLEPLGDNVIVKRLSPEDRTAGGIVLPDTAREKPQQGRVLSVGEGGRTDQGQPIAAQVKEGDRVLFSSYAGQQVEIDGDELLILSERDILAVLE